MNARFGLAGVLSASALCLVLASTACSGGDDDREDAGTNNTTSDAGTTDAGNDPVDAGIDPNDHAIGAACTAPVTAQQGDCEDGLICVLNAAFPGGLCTKDCIADADCGTNGSQQNQCVEIGGGKICMRGCDLLVANACNRGNHACNEEEPGVGVCATRCDAAPGSCPGGTNCNTQTGKCEARGPYETCQNAGDCSPGQGCVIFQGATEGLCLTDCTNDANACGAGSTCALDVGSNKACAQTCGTLTSPPCPATASRCAAVSQTVQVCVPPGPAGTQGSYQQCGGAFGACVDGADCAVGAQGASQGICLMDCTTNAGACTGDEQCTANGASKICLKPCSAGQTCPTGSACTSGFCGPAAP